MQAFARAAARQSRPNTPTAHQSSRVEHSAKHTIPTTSKVWCRPLGRGRVAAAASAARPHRGATRLQFSDAPGGAAMAKGDFHNIFADGPVVSVDEIDEHDDTDDTPASRRTRKVTGEREKLDDFELVLLGLSSLPFWDCVAYLVEHAKEHIKTFAKPGRPRKHTVADWVLFLRLADIAGGLRAAEDMLARHTNWLEARQVAANMAEQHGWTDKEWELSDKPINRFQFDRFLGNYIGPEQVLELRRITRGNALGDARTVGQFPAAAGSRPDPQPPSQRVRRRLRIQDHVRPQKEVRRQRHGRSHVQPPRSGSHAPPPSQLCRGPLHRRRDMQTLRRQQGTPPIQGRSRRSPHV